MPTASEDDDDPVAAALDPANVLPRRIRHWATHDPGRPFLIEADHGRSATYGELDDLVRRWVSVLDREGVGAGERVVSLLGSSVDAHALWLAAGLIGAAEVPVNPELRGEFLRHVLTDCGARLCVVRPDQAAIVEQSGVEGLLTLIAPRDGSLTAGVTPSDRGTLPGPGDVSCVIYTSGTTGPAKGVVICWAQLSTTIGRMPRAWFSAEDAVYSCWPMFHVTGRSPMFAMADVGGRVVLRERFSLHDFWPDVRTHGCTKTTMGAVFGLLMAQPERADDLDHPLRDVFFGKVGREGWQFARRFGVRAVSCYGSTEVGFPIVNRGIGDELHDDGERAVPGYDIAGWLRRGYSTRIVDGSGADVADGEVGELWIRPDEPLMIMRGYLDQPALTASAMADGWYRTGDAVRRLGDGGFVIIDRMRDTIRRFGENISSSALESVVASDPGVLDCAAVGVPSPITGQEILLFVVPPPGVTTDPAELWARLSEVLPRHMRPAYVAVVDELPTTPTGKVRKVGLADGFDLETAWRPTR